MSFKRLKDCIDLLVLGALSLVLCLPVVITLAITSDGNHIAVARDTDEDSAYFVFDADAPDENDIKRGDNA